MSFGFWQKAIKIVLKAILVLIFVPSFMSLLDYHQYQFKFELWIDIGIMAGVVLLWTLLAIHDELVKISDRLKGSE